MMILEAGGTQSSDPVVRLDLAGQLADNLCTSFLSTF
jgi:hypothetical protein